MHLKAIRIFVESVLRYGLPANFMTMLLRPGKGKVTGAPLFSVAEALLRVSCHI